MRVHVNDMILDMADEPHFLRTAGGSLLVLIKDRAVTVDSADVTMATNCWLSAGCPLPIEGERREGGYTFAFDVEAWHLGHPTKPEV